MALIASERRRELVGREPIARIVAGAPHAVDPDVFGIAPVRGRREARWREPASAGSDVAVVELNEAFASQCLA